MNFMQDGRTLFCAPIRSNNCAHLSGSTELPPESANWISTLLLTLSFWHRHCCHHNLADITKMHKNNLVTSMTIGSSGKPDIICEPCLARKMHSNPFPSSSSQCNTHSCFSISWSQVRYNNNLRVILNYAIPFLCFLYAEFPMPKFSITTNPCSFFCLIFLMNFRNLFPTLCLFFFLHQIKRLAKQLFNYFIFH